MGKVKDFYCSRIDTSYKSLSLIETEILGRDGYLEGILIDDGYSYEEDDEDTTIAS